MSIIDEEAGFKGIQREALQVIAKDRGPVMTVIGTGEDKNLLFILPAFAIKRDIIIIMVPLLALK